MSALTLLGFCFSMLLFFSGARSQGCGINPCEHICTDDGGGFVCSCWPNYELMADASSCRNEKHTSLDTVYLGCFQDDSDVRSFDYLIWDRADATVIECVASCRANGFHYAGLQAESQCWCDNSHHRLYDSTDTCTSTCSGSPSEVCGGSDALSVYLVPYDEPYMGCWNEDVDNREISDLLWEKSEGRPPLDCVTGCSEANYAYAALFNGGDCYCGNVFGTFGPGVCSEPCSSGYASSNCGGSTANAVYRVERGRDMSSSTASTDGKRATIEFANNLYEYPGVQGILTTTMITYASESINIPSEDAACFTGDCYAACDDIAVPDGFDVLSQNDMVIRDIHLKLTEVMPQYIEPAGYVPSRVYIYAQTLIIDDSVDFPFSVYMRARQIIIDYSVTPTITFDENGPDLGIDIIQALTNGPPSDLAFQKMSLLCARVLLGTSTDGDRLAYSIQEDIMKDAAYTQEQQYFINSISASRASLTSIHRNDLRWMPFNSQEYITSTLQLFQQNVQTYADDYTALLSNYENCAAFKSSSAALLSTWVVWILSHGEIEADTIKQAVQISQATYTERLIQFNMTRGSFEAAAESFSEGVEQERSALVRQAMFHFIDASSSLAAGLVPCGATGLVNAIQAALGGPLPAGLDTLELVMEDLAAAVQQIQMMFVAADLMIASGDYDRYLDNVEAVSSMYPVIQTFETFKAQVNIIMTQDEFRSIAGGLGFQFALGDVCVRGEQLTRVGSEYAMMLRELARLDSLYLGFDDMTTRYQSYFEVLGATCEIDAKEIMAKAFFQQHYDLMLATNDVLTVFCQTYVFDNFAVTCPEDTRPVYYEDLQNLALRLAEALAVEQPTRSPLSIEVTITDDVEDPSECVNDPDLCPVALFRTTSQLIFTLPVTHPRFLNIEGFIVDEIQLQFPGAVTTEPRETSFRLQVSKDGPFSTKLDEQPTLYSRGVSSLVYQYNVETGDIELFCILRDPSDGTLHQASPFTTWFIQIDPYSIEYIDVSNVQSIELTIIGSYIE